MVNFFINFNTRVCAFSSIFFLFVILLTACGGGGGGGDEGPTGPTPKTGVFIDSPVSNISYKTETQSGTTNDDGEFKYLDGETVTFTIGAVELPTVDAAPIITPLTFDSSGVTDITASQIATNIATLLMSLDTDSPYDFDNVIKIHAEATTFATTPVNFDQPIIDFRDDLNVNNLIDAINSIGGTPLIMPTTDYVYLHINYWLDELEQGIAGVYKAGETTIVLFDDNTFFYAEVEGDGPSGLEAGTYKFDIHNNEITFNVVTDLNGDGGIQSNGTGPDFTFPVSIDWEWLELWFKNAITFTLPDGDFTLASVDDFHLGTDQKGYVGYDYSGAWRFTDGTDTIFLLLNTNYTFLYAEYGPSSPSSGLEAGSYSHEYGAPTSGIPAYEPNTITFNLTYDDNEPGIGDIGTPIVKTQTYGLNTITLDAGLDGELELDREW